jgi:hypothetical protein
MLHQRTGHAAVDIAIHAEAGASGFQRRPEHNRRTLIERMRQRNGWLDPLQSMFLERK